MNSELKIGDKLCNFVAFYRSPSQTQDEFENYSDNLELNLGTLSQNQKVGIPMTTLLLRVMY